jgi:hypothetical protein
MEQLIFWGKFLGSIILIILVFYFLLEIYVEIKVYGGAQGWKNFTRKYKRKIDGSERKERLKKEESSRKLSEKRAKEAEEINKRRIEDLKTFREELIDGDSHCFFLDKKYILKETESGFERRIFDSENNVILTHIHDYESDISTILDSNKKELTSDEILNYFSNYMSQPWGQDRDFSGKKLTPGSSVRLTCTPKKGVEKFKIINCLNFIETSNLKGNCVRYMTSIQATNSTREIFIKLQKEKEERWRNALYDSIR